MCAYRYNLIRIRLLELITFNFQWELMAVEIGQATEVFLTSTRYNVTVLIKM